MNDLERLRSRTEMDPLEYRATVADAMNTSVTDFDSAVTALLRRLDDARDRVQVAYSYDWAVAFVDRVQELPSDALGREMRGRPSGLYRIYWKQEHGGGSSLAAVGQLHNGTRWFAATNWTSETPGGVISTDWSHVDRAELIEVPGGD